jgi:hypothetical protein
MTNRLTSAFLPLLLCFVLAPVGAAAQAVVNRAPESPRLSALKSALSSGRGEALDMHPLRLTAEIAGSRYCSGDRLNILQLSVRLRYQNVGSRKLLVYRGKNLFYQTRIRGGAGKPYEVVVTNSRYNDAEAEALGERKPGGAFVTLRPGATYETEVVVGVGVARGERVANTIAPGVHTLQVVTSSWYESRKLAEELRERWRGAGLLWIDPVGAQPLNFDAGSEAPAAPCR